MADDVQITAGSGTTIATDDIGSSRHAQIMKLAAGVNSSAVMIGHLEDDPHASGDAGIMGLGVRKDTAVALGADGDYTPLIVDLLNRLWVRTNNVPMKIQITPTISSGSAYASGDVIGGSSASIALSNAALYSGGGGYVRSILVMDKTQAQRAAMDIMFFDRSVTAAADNAAVATSDADMAYCLGVIPIGPYNTAFPGTPLNSISTLLNVGLPYVLNGTDLHVVIVSRGTPTYTSTSDLVFTFILEPR